MWNSKERCECSSRERNDEISCDQEVLFDSLSQAEGGCQAMHAVAGSGKTTLITGATISMIENNLGPNEKVAWVCKARKMRGAQVKVSDDF